MPDYLKYLRFFKPLADRASALVLLMALLPLFGGISLLLWLAGHHVLFVHPRPGRHGKVFNLLKFTTMSDGVTFRLGKWLRKSSLDELPQLWNVLKGEMSFVGPRPLLVDYLDLYTPSQLRRHDVMPGITGWAQVNGRNLLSLDEKVALDLYYVSHVSFWLDLKIIFKSIGQVFRTSEADYHNLASDPNDIE